MNQTPTPFLFLYGLVFGVVLLLEGCFGDSPLAPPPALSSETLSSDDSLKRLFEHAISEELALYKDTGSIIVRFENCELKIGHLFDSKRLHAIAAFTPKAEGQKEGTYTYFHVYKKEGKLWELAIDEKKPCAIKKMAMVHDINFDRRPDFIINWEHCGGYCNGSMYRLYLYDKKNNTFKLNTQLEKFSKIAVDAQKRIVYGADVCNNYYELLKWQKFELKTVEEVVFVCDEKKRTQCERKEYAYQKGKKVLLQSSQTTVLPIRWSKALKSSKL